MAKKNKYRDKSKIGNKKPKYHLGGWLNENLGIDESSFVGKSINTVGDLGTMSADNALGVFGAGNVIQGDQYSTNAIRNVSDVTSEHIYPMAGQAVANIVAPGVGGAALGAVQSGVGSAVGDPEREQMLMQQQRSRGDYAQAVREFRAEQGSSNNVQYNPVFENGGPLKKMDSRFDPMDVRQVDPELYVPYWMWKSGEFYSKDWDNPRTLAQSEVQPRLERDLKISRKAFKDSVKEKG